MGVRLCLLLTALRLFVSSYEWKLVTCQLLLCVSIDAVLNATLSHEYCVFWPGPLPAVPRFLFKANYSRGTRLIGAAFSTFAAFFYGFTLFLDIAETHDDLTTDTICILGSLAALTTSVVGCAVMLFCTICMTRPRTISVMSQGAAYLFGLGLAFYITYALCDSNFNAERYELAVDGCVPNPLRPQLLPAKRIIPVNTGGLRLVQVHFIIAFVFERHVLSSNMHFSRRYLVNYSLGSMSGCQTASLTPDDFVFPDSDLGNGSFSCGSYLGPDAGRCTVYSALVVFSRLYGFIFESFFIRLTVCLGYALRVRTRSQVLVRRSIFLSFTLLIAFAAVLCHARLPL